MTTARGILRKKAIYMANCMLYWIMRGTHLEVLARQAGENQPDSVVVVARDFCVVGVLEVPVDVAVCVEAGC
jgi:hypothetical protein